jgi:hypothetical protein
MLPLAPQSGSLKVEGETDSVVCMRLCYWVYVDAVSPEMDRSNEISKRRYVVVEEVRSPVRTQNLIQLCVVPMTRHTAPLSSRDMVHVQYTKS